MAISLYDISVGTYLQILGGVSNVLAKGEQFAADGGVDLDELVNYRLREDMAPFSFQLVSVWHHSLGAINGLKAGLFQPPPKVEDTSYAGLQALVAEAIAHCEAQSRDEIDALADQPVLFKINSFELPFTGANFIQSFSLPNFYFHATTTYDVLRLHGVKLGKMDFLGAMRVAT